MRRARAQLEAALLNLRAVSAGGGDGGKGPRPSPAAPPSPAGLVGLVPLQRRADGPLLGTAVPLCALLVAADASEMVEEALADTLARMTAIEENVRKVCARSGEAREGGGRAPDAQRAHTGVAGGRKDAEGNEDDRHVARRPSRPLDGAEGARGARASLRVQMRTHARANAHIHTRHAPLCAHMRVGRDTQCYVLTYAVARSCGVRTGLARSRLPRGQQSLRKEWVLSVLTRSERVLPLSIRSSQCRCAR